MVKPLVQQIRANNVAFIRSQQTLGATIVTPNEGDELRTYESGGKHPVRFKCLNPPEADTYLLIYRNGLYWPQPGPFRQIERRVWEIDAHFGTTGEHVLGLTFGRVQRAFIVRLPSPSHAVCIRRGSAQGSLDYS